jgi:hypothetical protein
MTNIAKAEEAIRRAEARIEKIESGRERETREYCFTAPGAAATINARLDRQIDEMRNLIEEKRRYIARLRPDAQKPGA